MWGIVTKCLPVASHIMAVLKSEPFGLAGYDSYPYLATILYADSSFGNKNLPSPCDIHTPSVAPESVDIITELLFPIVIDVKPLSCL